MLSILVWIVAIVTVVAAVTVLAAWRFSAVVAGKAAAAIPPAGRFTEVPGGRLHWTEKGEGPAVVMIHGLAGNLHNFTYGMLDRLAAAGYRAIAIDRPGCGWSERDGDEQARIPNQAAMIAALLEKEGIEKPLLVGHSLGGAVSLALALNHPERVGGLALVSALVKPPKAASDAFAGIDIANPAIRRVIAHTLAIPMSIRNGEKTLAIIFGPDAAPEDFRTRGGGLLSLRPRAFYAAATDLNAVEKDMASISARLAEVSVPVGLLYGMKDRILSAPEQIEALRAALPDADVETVEARGHMPIVVEPERVCAFVERMAARAG
jgi:pimeloyl-ACP methyl ester carboxylesterase